METVMQGPKKTYYSISEVCSMIALEPHVLRYWESEFPQLRPKKNRAGNRAYRDKDIETIEYIKRLLYEEKYTIPGARKKLSESKDSDVKESEEKVAIHEPVPSHPQPQARPDPAPVADGSGKSHGDFLWVIDELKDVLKTLSR